MRIASAGSVGFTLSIVFLGSPAAAQWTVSSPADQRSPRPRELPADGKAIAPGDPWPQDDKFRWLTAELTIPEKIDEQAVAGRSVGMRINCGDGGEVHVNGELQVRYDNDHPALVLLAEKAEPGTKVRVDVQVYGKVQGGDTFSEAAWTLIEPKRVSERLVLDVDPGQAIGDVPEGIIGLSQGGGLADYEDATAAKLKEGGFRWFRMDNFLTNALKKDEAGKFTYDWTDFDRRLDFIVKKMGAEPIFAVSYMPHVLDAVDNKDRQSAPSDYGVWEELCYQAAKHALDRGTRVPCWEVWNEANTGWIKPGPQDTGTDEMRRLYEKAIGRPQPDQEIIRRFEAYAKLYRATARGVRRADPQAKVGGPALASGPFEQSEHHFCANGRGFARGLMLWCQQENLPLDFVSWHEYFHPSDVIAGQADAMREYLTDFPELERTVKSFMLTEWNEAWWPNRPQDHEVGAAYCGDCVIRAFIPHGIDRPCFFYVKQNDMGFRGDWSMLMRDNLPKPSYHMAKMFNNLSGRWVRIEGTDDEVCAVAAWNPLERRLAIVLVNFKYRYPLRRQVQIRLDRLPRRLNGGEWREWTVDATHSNVWNDEKQADLQQTGSGQLEGRPFVLDRTLQANSVTLIELLGAGTR